MDCIQLSSAIAEQINGRKVKYALFTTYTFDPEFFELHILPLLFDRNFSNDPQVKRYQLSNALRDVYDIEVYYDYNAFSADSSAHLDYRRIPVSMNGAFHPKVILLIVENQDEKGNKWDSLIVVSGSGNITRSGHWENLEAFHIEEIKPGPKSEFRDSLLDFLNLIKRNDTTQVYEKRNANEYITQFLKNKVDSKGNSRGSAFYSSKDKFNDFISWIIRSTKGVWNFEIISPFFSEDAGNDLHEIITNEWRLDTILLYLPVDDEGKALCNEEYYKNIAKSENVKWAKFAKEDELGLAGKNKSLRNVHAKVYRFYSKDIEEEIIFVGSVNFSKQAFGLAGRKKNMEAGFIKYCDPPSYKP